MNRRTVVIASALAILVVIVALSLGKMQKIVGFLIGTQEPNDLVTKNLEWVDRSGQTGIAQFRIPYGYISKSAVERPKELIHLDVIYATREFYDPDVRKPNDPKRVRIYIESVNQTREFVTTGDRLRAAVDKGALPPHFFIADTRADVMMVETMPRRTEFDSRNGYLFQDERRGHWIFSRPLQLEHREAAGFTGDQVALVSYVYNEKAESNPKAMHSWVMTFVESLQRHVEASTAPSPRSP